MHQAEDLLSRVAPGGGLVSITNQPRVSAHDEAFLNEAEPQGKSVDGAKCSFA